MDRLPGRLLLKMPGQETRVSRHCLAKPAPQPAHPASPCKAQEPGSPSSVPAARMKGHPVSTRRCLGRDHQCHHCTEETEQDFRGDSRRSQNASRYRWLLRRQGSFNAEDWKNTHLLEPPNLPRPFDPALALAPALALVQGRANWKNVHEGQTAFPVTVHPGGGSSHPGVHTQPPVHAILAG